MRGLRQRTTFPSMWEKAQGDYRVLIFAMRAFFGVWTRKEPRKR